MKFGLFILPSWPEQETYHQSRIFAEAVEQIQYAEELGFESVWLAEHHFTRFGICPVALPFAYYVAAKTRTIRVGTGVSVLTFQNPVFLAEETAMLDVLSIRSLYHERCLAAGKPSRLADMPFFRLVYVAEDEKHAREDPRQAMTWVGDLNGLRRTLTGGSEIYMDLEHWHRTRPSPPASYETQLRTAAYFGTPDQMVGWLRTLQQEHDVHYFGLNTSFGTMPHDKVMRSMELFAKEVMPAFR